MENQIKTVEQLQQEINRLKLAEVDYKSRADNYDSMIQTLMQFKNNCQNEYYNIRQDIRDNERDIAAILCSFKTGDRYITNKIVMPDNTEFFQVKIEHIRFDLYTSSLDRKLICNTIISLKGKSSKTNKWRTISDMTEKELQSIIIGKVSC
jgi:hypothetical protein